MPDDSQPFDEDSEHGAATQRLYYLASHLKLEGTPAENWKLKIGSTKAATMPAEGPVVAGCAATAP